MYKKTITYTDFNDEEITEDFYFNLSKSELLEIDLKYKGGFEATIQRIIEAEDVQELIAVFKDIIKMSYGEKSEDGRHFFKNEDIFEKFASTEAYSELFFELATNDKAASEFINGIISSAVKHDDAGNNIKVLNS